MPFDAFNYDFNSLALLANANSPWLFLVLLLFAAVQEDIATVTIALLAAHGHVPVQLAFGAILTGIVLCDLGIFAAGWFARGHRFAYKLLKSHKVRRVRRLLGKNLISTILITRALPGMRLPIFFALGFFRASPLYFGLIACGAVSLWSAFLFGMSYMIGNQLLVALTGPWFWIIVLLFMALILVLPRVIVKFLPGSKALDV